LTPNSLARAAFVLFGAYLVVEFFVSVGHSLIAGPFVYVADETGTRDLLAGGAMVVALRVAASG